MAPKEPTRAQLSSRLTYQAHTPSFLQKFQNRVAGIPDDDEPFYYNYDEFEYDGSGRPPIPKRPPIPERPADNPGSDDEDAADEAPQVIVLKEGKHLSAREAEDERRKAKGLPPANDSFEALKREVQGGAGEKESETEKESASTKPKPSTGLSFSSGSSNSKPGKRKAVDDLRAETKNTASSAKGAKKKAKKPQKKLLSFGDDA